MHTRKIAASAAIVGVGAIALWLMLSVRGSDGDATLSTAGTGGASADRGAAQTAIGADPAKRRADEALAVREFLSDFDRYIAMLMSGDDSLDNAGRMEMAYKLERAIEFSPLLRDALKRRLETAFKNNEVTALMELERAFNSSSVGTMALLEVYQEQVERGGVLDYYAMQNASYFQGAISDEARGRMIERAFVQLDKYDEHAKYNGAMLFLSTAVRSGAKIPPHYVATAISAIEGKLYDAPDGDSQYFAAQNLYKLMSAQDAAKRAMSVLEQRPTFSVARATLEAMVHGRMAVDPALVRALTRVAAGQAMSNTQSTTLQELLAQVPSTTQGNGGG
jgi:hypothetical protein